MRNAGELCLLLALWAPGCGDPDGPIVDRQAEAEALCQEAFALLNDQHFEEARETFTCAIKKEPEYAAAHFGLGLAYGVDNPAKALPELDRALVCDPAFAIALIARGLVNESLGYVEDADRDWCSAYEIDESLYPETSSGVAQFARRLIERRPWRFH